jgi:outer membrane protein OmpA-like peptidoglycan-associated protein
MDPVSNRVSQSENRLTQGEGRLTQSEKQIGAIDTRITGIEGKLGQFEGRLGQVDAKANKALNALSNLRLERRFVIDLKEGANFAFGSSNLPNQAQKEIDRFLLSPATPITLEAMTSTTSSRKGAPRRLVAI